MGLAHSGSWANNAAEHHPDTEHRLPGNVTVRPLSPCRNQNQKRRRGSSGKGGLGGCIILRSDRRELGFWARPGSRFSAESHSVAPYRPERKCFVLFPRSQVRAGQADSHPASLASLSPAPWLRSTCPERFIFLFSLRSLPSPLTSLLFPSWLPSSSPTRFCFVSPRPSRKGSLQFLLRPL